jgi:hypothetical protein
MSLSVLFCWCSTYLGQAEESISEAMKWGNIVCGCPAGRIGIEDESNERRAIPLRVLDEPRNRNPRKRSESLEQSASPRAVGER